MGTKYKINLKNKPTLFMCIGTGWSGTSPLYYTLGDWNRYCHCGHLKENKYLEHIYHWNIKDYYTLDKKKVTFRRVMHETFRDDPDNEKFMEFGLRDRPSQVMYTSGANEHWTREYTDKFFSQPHTFQKYINYYKLHHENVVENGEYQAVSDFTVNNIYLPEDFVKLFADQVREIFNVKIIITCRDPVRRAWSKNQFRWFQRKKRGGCQDPWHLYWQCLLGKNTHLCGHEMDVITLYTEGYRRWCEAFGEENVHMTVMEELWERNGDKWGGKEAMEKLSDFIGYKIDDMFPNVYVPEMGSRAPKLPNLSDQWMSDQVDLSHQQQQVARCIMDEAYTEWERVFGSIPESWMTMDTVKVPQLNEMSEEETSKALEEIMRIDPGCIPTSDEAVDMLNNNKWHT